MTDVAVLDAPQTAAADTDVDRLAELERVVAAGVSTFIAVGLALAEIRDRGLFRLEFASFAEYVRERWDLGTASAYATIYSARVAEALSAEHELPAGISADALKPLWPLLNREGPEAVARAWDPIAERCNGRPPSRSLIQRVLVEQGVTTTAPEKPKPVQLATIEAGLAAADQRLGVFLERQAGAPLSRTQRERAAHGAELARRLAAALEALADVRTARKMLAALEPLPESELCLGHGALRDERGVCRRCRRPDVRNAWGQ